MFQPIQRARGECGSGSRPGPAIRRLRGSQPAHWPHPSPRLAGALDISSCPQSRKDVLYAKAREAFGSAGTTAAYYRFMRPYLGETLPSMRGSPPLGRRPPPLTAARPPGGAPVEELQHLAQANVTMDIDTFTNLNPRVLQVSPKPTPQAPRDLKPEARACKGGPTRCPLRSLLGQALPCSFPPSAPLSPHLSPRRA